MRRAPHFLPATIYHRHDGSREIALRRRTGSHGVNRSEQALYAPVKRFLETLGYAVKGEIGDCDLVALKGDDPPLVVIGELKLRFTLDLLLQAVDRAGACDEVWVAARLGPRGGREADPRFRNLCRRLGFGLIGVDTHDRVHLLLAPDAPMPRRDAKRRSRLVAEHRRRIGDPTHGGGSRAPIMTAYRQQALLCAARLQAAPGRPRDLTAQVPRAPQILRDNVYGWFVRVSRGLYGLTDVGAAALVRWPQGAPSGPTDAHPL